MHVSPPDPEHRRRELVAEISELGFVLPGSLNVVTNRCGKPSCRCHADPPKLHGPYLTWTRKVSGKTVTRRLTTEQADRYRPWLTADRRLHELVTELQALSLQIAEQAEGWGAK
jgi:uncharacterized protein DUF6788